MHPEVLDIFAAHPDCYFQVFTNGQLVTPDVARRLRQIGNVTPLVSIEGTEIISDERRGRPEVYARSMDGLQNCLDNKLLTEAMLRAYRSDLAPPQAPNIYDDPTRISALLVPGSSSATPRDPTAAQRQAGTAGRQPAGQGATVLREGDLDRGNPAGQAMPQGGAPPGVGVPITRTTPRSLREWNRPDPTFDEVPEGMQVPDEEQPPPVITPPPGGVYYRPGVQSTGRLSLQVVSEGRRAGRSGPTR